MRRMAAILGAVGLAGGLWGCTQMAGLAYIMGAGRETKVEAKYTLPQNTLLVLVDDPNERVAWPEVRRSLASDVGETLIKQKCVPRLIRPESVAKMRQADSEFEKLSALAVGEKLDADTVLWIEVREFFAPKEIEDTASAARMTVSVKVLSTHATEPEKVRLWPEGSTGEVIETTLKAVQVQKLQGDTSTARELAKKTAASVSRLFYTHTLGELDDEE